MYLRGFELIILLKHRRRILLRCFEYIKLYLNARAAIGVIILNGHRAVAAFDPVHIGCQKLCVFADFFPAVGAFKLLEPAYELALYAVSRSLDGMRKLPRSAPPSLQELTL